MAPTLAEIKAAAEAATPGPWGNAGYGGVSEADAAFIALSREAVPWLVERVEELAKVLRVVVDDLEVWAQTYPRYAEGPTTRALNRAHAALARLEDS